ncbi:MAG: polyribonucleotide nucleotidyltransferase [Candidatus Kerfeldbacteria bacterium]|nr:polyribonucleotide nucleotidyltransferase [Candidatus Kerfeldbacteria bacterium]
MAVKQFTTEFAGRTLTIETGKLAQQAHGSCTVRYGDTVVLATAVMSNTVREGIDYFPLLVDYEERLYAAGKIKGSRFIKREGRPTDEAVLTARIVDRSLRPLFNQTIRNDVQVTLTVFSVDQENDPDLVSLWAASCALTMSNIPWGGPLTAMRIGRINGEWVLNPTYEARLKSDFELFVVGHDDRTVMIELEGKQVAEDVVADAVEFAQKHWGKVLTLIEEVRAAVGAKKSVPDVAETDEAERTAGEYLERVVQGFAKDKIATLFKMKNKQEREAEITRLTSELEELLKKDNQVSKENRFKGVDLFTKLFDEEARRITLEKGSRVDGRAPDEIRPLNAEVGLLPRTHGSALFSRGETQVLSIITLGSPGDEQVLDTMEESGKKRYMHHYNFPGFSTGEVKPIRSPGRREIGHGALAEKAIEPVLPEKEQFPYTIRVVSEVLSSNGSTSMASTCGSTLALMDAGVPISAPVAGISIGSVIDNDTGKFRLLTDIQGFEDHAGNMDFKVAGTKDGITAIQLDIKEVPLTNEIIRKTLTQAKAARLKILETMTSAIAEPRPELSPYAPRITTIRIDPEKIREVIGKGGETINKIIDECGGKDVTKIDIEDDGLVMITSTNAELAAQAKKWIEDLTRDVKPGEVYEGTVTRIIKDMRDNEVGAIVEILPGQDGMVHISEISPERVANVTDFLNVDDKVKVVVTEVDKERGRIGLSIKRLTHPSDDYDAPRGPRGGTGGHGRFGDRGSRPVPRRRHE